jgi:hypothetical protein
MLRRLAVAGRQAVPVPASEHRQLEDVDVSGLDSASAEASMSLEEAVHPAVDLERPPDASRYDGQIVGGIAATGVLPVDEPRWSSGSKEDVLSEEVAVQE